MVGVRDDWCGIIQAPASGQALPRRDKQAKRDGLVWCERRVMLINVGDTHMRIWSSEDWNREEGCWVVCGVSETDSSSLVKRVVDSGSRDRPGKCNVGGGGIGG